MATTMYFEQDLVNHDGGKIHLEFGVSSFRSEGHGLYLNIDGEKGVILSPKQTATLLAAMGDVHHYLQNVLPDPGDPIEN